MQEVGVEEVARTQGTFPDVSAVATFMKDKRRDEVALTTRTIMAYMWQLEPDWVTNYMAKKRSGLLALQRMCERLANRVCPRLLENLREYEPSEILNVDETAINFDMPPRVFGPVEDGGTSKHAGRMTAVLTIRADETAHGDPVASDARLDGSVAPAGLHDGSVASAGLIDGSVAPAGRHDDSAAPAGRRDGSVAPAERLDSWVARAAAEPATATPAVTTVSEEVATAESAATLAPDDLYQLLVRPIVKASINQRDTSAETLSDVVFSGRLFDGIMEAIWEKFSSRVKKYAVKTDGVWSVETPQFAAWPKLMQFKMKKRVVDSTKSDQAWKQWLVAARGATVTLMIYEFGMAIPTAKDRDDFMKACILPEETDRAGASAESSLREVVEALREEWGTTFQAVSVVW
ncbi:hypothetical protein JG688_00012432, partial [Phytophthora aleatoria]